MGVNKVLNFCQGEFTDSEKALPGRYLHKDTEIKPQFHKNTNTESKFKHKNRQTSFLKACPICAAAKGSLFPL
jgi:hypothetical protein